MESFELLENTSLNSLERVRLKLIATIQEKCHLLKKGNLFLNQFQRLINFFMENSTLPGQYLELTFVLELVRDFCEQNNLKILFVIYQGVDTEKLRNQTSDINQLESSFEKIINLKGLAIEGAFELATNYFGSLILDQQIQSILRDSLKSLKFISPQLIQWIVNQIKREMAAVEGTLETVDGPSHSDAIDGALKQQICLPSKEIIEKAIKHIEKTRLTRGLPLAMIPNEQLSDI